jgi:outer membrane protein assembly factor BamC
MNWGLSVVNFSSYAARVLLVTIVVANLGACSYFKIFRDKGNDYLKAENTAPTVIPDELDTPPFQDLMAIPEVVDSRGISGKELELTLPAPLSSTYGVDRIVIRKLGDNHWIFLDATSATVWPKLRDFWVTNNMDIDSEDPRNGWIETKWLLSRDGNADEIYTSLISGKARFDSRSAIESKFRMQIDPGVRQGSSEVRIQYLQVAVDDENKHDLSWDSDAVNRPEIIAVEEKVLTQLAQYIGETLNQRSTVSMLASTMGKTQRAVLTPDKVRPVLTYYLDYDRTWSTVENAIRNAGITIEEEDHAGAMLEVVYQDSSQKDAGFISRIFSGDDDESQDDAIRYKVRLEKIEDKVEVTVYKTDTELADANMAERILKIIKEYST